jgi:hypothetical protein
MRRHAWKPLAAVSVIVALFGLSDLAGGARDLGGGESALMAGLTGTSWEQLRTSDPGAAHLVDWKFRSDGATLLALGLLGTALSAFGLRRGERWAWLVLWVIPGWMGLTVATVTAAVEHPGFGIPVPAVSGSLLGVVSAAALAAGYPVHQDEVG